MKFAIGILTLPLQCIAWLIGANCAFIFAAYKTGYKECVKWMETPDKP
jgi:hypothetical protein